jgi:hypothetical protein
MSHICANDEYRSQVEATNRPKNIVIRYINFVDLSSICMYVCMYVFEFESSRRFQFSFTDFSLVYRSAFVQIFPRSQPMRKSNISILVEYCIVRSFKFILKIGIEETIVNVALRSTFTIPTVFNANFEYKFK